MTESAAWESAQLWVKIERRTTGDFAPVVAALQDRVPASQVLGGGGDAAVAILGMVSVRHLAHALLLWAADVTDGGAVVGEGSSPPTIRSLPTAPAHTVTVRTRAGTEVVPVPDEGVPPDPETPSRAVHALALLLRRLADEVA